MLKLAANISVLFTEAAFCDRPQAAHAAGFSAIECHDPFVLDAGDLNLQLQRLDLHLALFNMPKPADGPWRRGLACVPGRESAFRDTVLRARDFARAVRCPRVNIPIGDRPDDVSAAVAHRTCCDNLAFAAAAFAEAGVCALIEPLNSEDFPGYFLPDSGTALGVLEAVKHPNLRLQWDAYHAWMAGEDPVASLGRAWPAVAHVQIADAPGRHEPGTGRIDFDALFALIETRAYSGWIGCEYRPAGPTIGSLAWARPHLRA